jgi:hypothetical protein
MNGRKFKDWFERNLLPSLNNESFFFGLRHRIQFFSAPQKTRLPHRGAAPEMDEDTKRDSPETVMSIMWLV